MKKYYYLDEAAKLLTDKSNFPITRDDLIDQAIEGNLLMAVSANNWMVKHPKMIEPFRFDGYCNIEKIELKSLKQTLAAGKAFFKDGVSVKREELINYSIFDDEEYKLLLPAKLDSCPLLITDLVISNDMLEEFIEYKFHAIVQLATINSFSKEGNGSDQQENIDSSIIKSDSIQNSFEKSGDYWNITFNSKKISIKDSKGIGYIHYLIRNMNKDIHVNDLYIQFHPIDISQVNEALSLLSHNELENQGLTLLTLQRISNVFHPKIKQRLAERLNNIRDDIDESISLGDEDKQLRLESEQDIINKYLNDQYNHRGQANLNDYEIEKRRKSISKCINNDIKKLKKSHYELAVHLKCIKLGYQCSYKPDFGIEWK